MQSNIFSNTWTLMQVVQREVDKVVLIPSGTGKVYSQKPVSADGDFTLTSSSAATKLMDGSYREGDSQTCLDIEEFNQGSAWSKQTN